MSCFSRRFEKLVDETIVLTKPQIKKAFSARVLCSLILCYHCIILLLSRVRDARFEESHLIWDLYFFFLIQFNCKIFQPKHVFILLLLAKITYIFRSQEAFSWVEFNPVFNAPLLDNFFRLFEETHYVTVEPLDQD